MCVAICGRFRLNEGGVADYINGIIFQTRSRIQKTKNACLKLYF
ncbi:MULTISPECIES: DUF6783 domain-containing protein [Anaerobutyricum]